MKKPLVSVIIPHFRRTDLTIRAIDSVLTQKGININDVEIIISVDGPVSAKDKGKIGSRFPKVHLLRNFNQEGPGGNRQSGLQRAMGEFIIFLDSDDQLKPYFISQMVSSLQKDRRASAAVCLSRLDFTKDFPRLNRIKITILDLFKNLGLLSGFLFNQGYLYSSSFYFCQLSHMVFRRSVVETIKFSYDYRRGGEDWDFIVSTQKSGPIKIILKPLLQFYYSSGSSTFSAVNLKLKWQSYTLLTSRLPKKLKRGLFYTLFRLYIKLFSQSSSN